MKEKYYLYWLNADGSKTFWLNEELGTDTYFNSYDELFSIAGGLKSPYPESRLQYEVVKL